MVYANVKIQRSLFYLSSLFSIFLSSAMFQMDLRPSLSFFLGPRFWFVKINTQNTTFISYFFISKLRLFEQSSFSLLNIDLAPLVCVIMFF
jgi:hypothetical protein